MRFTLLLAGTLLVMPTLAAADAIDGPPEHCPRGTIGESDHSGSWCAPSTCRSDAECGRFPYPTGASAAALACRAQGVCVRSETYRAGGMRPVDVPPEQLTREVASGECTTDAECAAPARCITGTRCVPVSAPAQLASACGCRAGSRSTGAFGGSVIGMALMFSALRRRRR